jgi:bacillithiol system protein YtxJ
MFSWKALETVGQVEEIAERSHNKPCVIFKHSTRCNISYIAKHRLEQKWDFEETEVESFYLDLIAFRKVSNYVAERFAVHHESPQLLLIRNGECTCETSHLDISVEELRDCFHSAV